ncbi:hypothetical protein Tco_0973756 [Tanacetum coccineum]|uniref:Uncharacterized protein n=1 Tax=Tanacetum coccineum TaxID=301880 RepID=A0ABQ5E9L9_9ASTR
MLDRVYPISTTKGIIVQIIKGIFHSKSENRLNSGDLDSSRLSVLKSFLDDQNSRSDAQYAVFNGSEYVVLIFLSEYAVLDKKVGYTVSNGSGYTVSESKDLSTLPLDELIGNLKVYEVVIEKDLGISKNKEEKYKSLAPKARKVLSEEEATTSDSNDEEYAMAVRDFKKFFKRRGKFVSQPHDDKKNFRKSKEDKKEKDDRRCFKCGDPNHFISYCHKHFFND